MTKLLCVFLVILLGSAAWSGEVDPEELAGFVEGGVREVRNGPDSCVLQLETTEGPVTVRKTSNLDDLPPEYRTWLLAQKASRRPSLTDVGSQARARVLWAADDPILVDFQILRPAAPLWVVIVHSGHQVSEAWQLASSASALGFACDVIDSSEYPALRPGYQVVLAGAFTRHNEAEAALARARKHWPGAYLRKLR
ncbi:MAG: hypothetical protein HY319_08660 [Armatimonadetes bacterium]|nr:hypothetical protein [Armatimonadota bacterium]